MSDRKWAFPLHIGWSVAAVVAWNGLFKLDQWILGPNRLGFFGFFASLAFTVLFVTAPGGRRPGRWFVKDEGTVYRFRWLFWYMALLTTASACLCAYQAARALVPFD